jgi:tRNA threonylcarbamoyl adenosine modification protein YeaZ
VRLVLAIDTATAECSIGLGLWPYGDEGEPQLLGETNIATPRAALTHAVPAITRLLEDCGHHIGEVGAIVVGRGPGSFTGARIGISTAKGLAQGLGVPLYGVGTLDAVAERFAGRDGLVAVVGDAMRKEVYPALFRASSGHMERLNADCVKKPVDAAAAWAESVQEPVLLAGDGLAKYADVFTDALGERAEIAPQAMWSPTGASLLQAAWRGRVGGSGGSAAAVLPIYTRLSDAEEAEALREGRPAGLPGSGVAGPETEGGRP